MLVIIAVIGAVFSTYLVAPALYTQQSYQLKTQYTTLAECESESHGVDALCTTEEPYQLLVRTDSIPAYLSTGKFIDVPCDYWAGCYRREGN